MISPFRAEGSLKPPEARRIVCTVGGRTSELHALLQLMERDDLAAEARRDENPICLPLRPPTVEHSLRFMLDRSLLGAGADLGNHAFRLVDQIRSIRVFRTGRKSPITAGQLHGVESVVRESNNLFTITGGYLYSRDYHSETIYCLARELSATYDFHRYARLNFQIINIIINRLYY